MNIEDLIPPPIGFHAAPLGDLQLDVVHRDFMAWAEAGEKTKRWTDGASFVRRLLIDRVVSSPGGEPIGAAPVEAMGDDLIEAAAAALLAKAVHYFRVSLIALPGQGRRRVRVRRANEAYDPAARPEETEADRLLRLVRDSHQDHHDHTTLVLAPQFDAIDAVRKADPFSTIRSAIEQAGLPRPSAYLSATNHIAEIQRARNLASLAGVSNAHLASSQIERSLASLTATGQLGAYPSVLTSLPRAIGVDLLKTYDLEREGAVRIAVERALGVGDLASTIAQHLDFARDVNRRFHLELPSGMFAAAGLSALSVTAIAEFALRPALFPPGFQVAAALGLQDRAPRGAVADILRYYDGVDAAEAPAFAGALDTVHALDAEEPNPTAVDGFLVRFWAIASALIANEGDPVRRVGLVAVVSLVVAIVSASAGIYYGAKAVELAKGGPTAKDVAAQTEILKDIRGELKAHAAPAPADRRLRYVHADAPLRAEPDGGALVLRIVYADQTLRIIDERGAWAKVEVFNFHTDQNMTGWINRRRLRLEPRH